MLAAPPPKVFICFLQIASLPNLYAFLPIFALPFVIETFLRCLVILGHLHICTLGEERAYLVSV